MKVLGQGELSKAITVHAHKFSKSAQEKIEKAGGKIKRQLSVAVQPAFAGNSWYVAGDW